MHEHQLYDVELYFVVRKAYLLLLVLSIRHWRGTGCSRIPLNSVVKDLSNHVTKYLGCITQHSTRDIHSTLNRLIVKSEKLKIEYFRFDKQSLYLIK